MKIIVADAFSPAGIEELKASGANLIYNKDLSDASLLDAMASEKPDILVVRSTKVPANIIDSNPALQLIVRAGAGYDTIDFVHASKKGIYVANCPGKNANAVAELTVGLMLSIDRRTAEGNALLKEGKWNKGMFASCKGVRGRTIGIIGFGNIGQAVCAAAKALGMEVIVSTRTHKAGLDKQLGFTYASTDDLLAKSDIVSLHTPSTAETKGMVNKEFLGKMKENGVLINTSRANVVDEEALLAKLEACKDFWVGSDVFVGEPSAKVADFTHALAQHPRVYGTHHCGASTAQAESAIGQEAVRIIKKFASEGALDKANWVNSASVTDTEMGKVQVRHLDQVGVLASVFSVFAENGWNVQELENIVFKEREACVANILFTGDVAKGEGIKKALEQNASILSVNIC